VNNDSDEHNVEQETSPRICTDTDKSVKWIEGRTIEFFVVQCQLNVEGIRGRNHHNINNNRLARSITDY
jgi:hypothetical protein